MSGLSTSSVLIAGAMALASCRSQQIVSETAPTEGARAANADPSPESTFGPRSDDPDESPRDSQTWVADLLRKTAWVTASTVALWGCSGGGTGDGSGFVANDVTLTVAGPGSTTFSGPAGGPFSSLSDFRLTNNADSSIDWSASFDQSWATLSQTTGSLASGASLDLSLTLDTGLVSGFAEQTVLGTLSFQDVTLGSEGSPITYDVTLLIADAIGALVVTPSDSFVTSGAVGGPFLPDSKSVTLTTGPDSYLDWRAMPSEPWLDVSPAFGTLGPGQAQVVDIEIDVTSAEGAQALSSGDYFAQVAFVNMKDGGGEVAVPVTLRAGAGSPVIGTTYYIDFDGGDDAASGQAPGSAWQHCPGDANAVGVAGSTVLSPGDRVLFRGGVHYRGSIVAQSSGMPGVSITYDGNTRNEYGVGRAVIDGSEPLTGWVQVDALHYRASLPAGVDLFDANLLADESLLTLAQDPTPSFAVQFDTLSEYRPASPSSVSSTSLTDPGFLGGLAADFWEGGYISIWAQPNQIYIRRLTGYNPGTATISFEAIGSPYTDRDTLYAIINTDEALDTDGEYVVDAVANTVTLRPLDPADVLNDRVTVSVRRFGFDLAGNSHLTVQGFRIIKQSGTLGGFNEGCGIRSTGAAQDVHVLTNEVTMCRSMEKTGGLSLRELSQSSVAGNFIHRNVRSRGVVFTQDCDSLYVGRNCLYANGGTGFIVFETVDSLFEYNAVLNHRGTHANGLSFYIQAHRNTARYNLVLGGNIALTSENSDDLTFYRNILYTPAAAASVTAADWGGSTGLRYLNNVIMSDTDSALSISSSSQTGAQVKNNILDGGLFTAAAIDNTHNIYSSLSWMQNQNTLSTAEQYVPDKSTLFLNASSHDYQPVSWSPAIDAGTNVGLGSGLGAGVDIGAIEYVP